MNKIWTSRSVLATTALTLLISADGIAQAAPAATAGAAIGQTAEALVYSTMPSTAAHNPVMAMDGDTTTYYKSVYGMDDGDDFLVLLSRPVPAQSLDVETGDSEGDDQITNGYVETSPDGIHFTKAGSFNSQGIVSAKLGNAPVEVIRVKVNRGGGVPNLVIKEISLKSPVKISHVEMGSGRGFYDVSQAPDVAVWAAKAESQMESFWPDTAALLYSDKFITPNMVSVVYRTGPDVTPVAATGGGVMTVNADWCRKHADDTGLTVHETAHVVQSMSAYNPVWLIEGTADYIRWVKFEPQNFTYRIDPAKSTYHDSYRTTAAFLGWCELHYDSRLVTKMNQAIRFGQYNDGLWQKFCGKSADALWTEFLAAYEANPKTVLSVPIPAADQPRELPVVTSTVSVPQDISSAFNTTGVYDDGATFTDTGGIDSGGAAYSSALLGSVQTSKGVKFNIGPAKAPDIISCHGQVIPVSSDNASSLWILATAVDGNQMSQVFTVTYANGQTQQLYQNMSDWYQPQSFPGEVRAVKMPYRNMANGQKDPRAFYLYAYGFKLDGDHVKSITLPNNDYVKVAAISLPN